MSQLTNPLPESDAELRALANWAERLCARRRALAARARARALREAASARRGPAHQPVDTPPLGPVIPPEQRDMPGRGRRKSSLGALEKANAARSDEAAERDIPAARAILASGVPLKDIYREALQARVDHPDENLVQIAARLGVPKGALSKRLKRGLACGSKN